MCVNTGFIVTRVLHHVTLMATLSTLKKRWGNKDGPATSGREKRLDIA